MNGEFFIDGKKYISANRASKLTGYAMDYVGQLARGGKIDSKMIGRGWFVNEESLLGYKREVLDLLYTAKKARKDRTKKTRNGKNFRLAKIVPSQPEAAEPEASQIPAAILSAFPEAEEDLGARAVLPEAPVPAAFVEIPAAAPADAFEEVLVPPGPSVRFVTLAELADMQSSKISLADARRRKTRDAGAAVVRDIEAPALAEARASAEVLSEAPALARSEASAPEVAAEAISYAVETPAPRIAPAASPYYEFGFLKGLGNMLLGAAAAMAIVTIIASTGAAYQGAESGALAFGSRARGTGEVASRIFARTPLYLHAGVAAVGRSLALNTGGSEAAGTSPSAIAKEPLLSRVEMFGARISKFFDDTLLAISNGTENLFGKLFVHVQIKTTKLATEASQDSSVVMPTDGTTEGMAIVPSTGDAEEDRKITAYIKDSFSDDVKVVSRNDDGTGVIQPVFKSGKQDKYLYVLVPIPTGS